MNATIVQGATAAGGAGKLPWGLKLGWGIGALGPAILLNGVAAMALFYMTSILGISPSLAGAIIFVTKILDVLSDPLVGMWSDRSRAPGSRRRPFLIWGALLGGASFAVIFTTPVFASEWLMAAYVFLALLIYTVGYTLFNIPFMAMPAEMTDDYHERSSIHGYRMVFVAIGSFLAANMAPFLAGELGKGAWSSYAVVGVIGGGLAMVAMLVAYLTTKSARYSQAGAATPPILSELSAVRGNPHFLRLIGVKLCQLTGVQLFQAGILFYLIQVLELDFAVLPIIGIASTAMAIIAAPLLVMFSKRYGKRWAYILAGAVYMLQALSWLLAGPGEPLWALIARSMALGVAFSGNVVLAMSMLTDIINYDAKLTGVRREGVYTALYSFVEKFTAALAPLIIGIGLDFAGFDKDLPVSQPQGDNVVLVLQFTLALLPAILAAVAVWLIYGYRLSEKDFSGEEAKQ